MSTQAVSNSSILQVLQGFYQDRRTDLQQLGSALKAGDLNQAKEAFSTLVALGKRGTFSNTEPFSSETQSQAFEAIGHALEAGDLTSAKAAFASLQPAPNGTANPAATSVGNSNGTRLPSQGANQAFIVNLTFSHEANATTPPDSIPAQGNSYRQQRRAGLELLGQALRSGNTEAAQHVYDALIALGHDGPLRNGQTFQRADRAQDFATIGEALASGNLAGARGAFLALASTFGGHLGNGDVSTPPPGPVGPPTPVPTTIPPQDTLPPTPGPRPTPQGGENGNEIVINVGGSSAANSGPNEIVVSLPALSSTPEEVQINFGDSQGSGGRLTIDARQLTNGGEQVAININPRSNHYQLVLNLFQTQLDRPAESSSLSLQA